MKNNIENILITGSTRGLGLEYARHLASKGYNIGITDISKTACRVYDESQQVQDILNELSSYGVETWYQSADLTDPAQANDLVASFLEHFGEIHAVVASAGGDISGNDSDAAGGKPNENSFFISYEEHQNIFKRNFDSCLNTLRSVVPHLKDQGFGRIITVSSINAAFGVEKETSYSVAKSAIVQLTRCLARELRKDGVNVNCIMPGPVKTGRFMATLKGRNPHDLNNLQSKSRLERVAEPHDISPVVEFLLSSSSGFISGEVIKIDGALICQAV